MDLQVLAGIIGIMGGLASIWVAFSLKPVPDRMKIFAIRQKPERIIVAVFLLLIATLVSWMIIRSSLSKRNLTLLDLLTIGLVASAVGLLISRTEPFHIFGEGFSGIVGAAFGAILASFAIHTQGFYANICIVFACAVALITVVRCLEYSRRRDADRFTIALLLLIVAIFGECGLYLSFTMISLWWYLVFIGCGVSALSLLLPVPANYPLHIIGETIIGPSSALIGGLLTIKILHIQQFYLIIGIDLVVALAFTFFPRLVYYQHNSERENTGSEDTQP